MNEVTKSIKTNDESLKILDINLTIGDIITITSINNPNGKGLIGSLHFFDNNDREIIYNTGIDWYCNKKTAIVSENNIDNIQSIIPQIDSQAKWIWKENSNNSDKPVTCSFKIPCI